MNQENIGKFIKKCRMERKLTQSELASILGVSDRTVGNWENGRNMPDISLFNPLCESLGISMSELLRGEENREGDNANGEENVRLAIDYAHDLLDKRRIVVALVKLTSGLGLVIFCNLFYLIIRHADGVWYTFYDIFPYSRGILFLVGLLLVTSGMYTLLKSKKKQKAFLVSSFLFVSLLSASLGFDYFKVKNNLDSPLLYRLNGLYYDVLSYETPLYNLYIVHPNTIDEYTVFDAKKEYSIETLRVKTFSPEVALSEVRKKEDIFTVLPLNQLDPRTELNENALSVSYTYGDTLNVYSDEYIMKSFAYNALVAFTLQDLEVINYEILYPNPLRIMKYTITKESMRPVLAEFEEKGGNVDITDDDFEKVVQEALSDSYLSLWFRKIELVDLDALPWLGG